MTVIRLIDVLSDDEFAEVLRKELDHEPFMVIFVRIDGLYMSALRLVANDLKAHIRRTDKIGRTELNEFAVLVRDCSMSGVAHGICRRLSSNIDTMPFAVSLAMTYAFAPFDGKDIATLRRQATPVKYAISHSAH